MRLDTLGFHKKIKAMQTMITFYEEAPRDACAEFVDGVVTGAINGQLVGVVSGNLKRSVDVEITSRFSAAVISDMAIAPYTKEVRKRTLDKFGEDFYQFAERVYGPDIMAALRKEWGRAMSTVASRSKYKYQYPF